MYEEQSLSCLFLSSLEKDGESSTGWKIYLFHCNIYHSELSCQFNIIPLLFNIETLPNTLNPFASSQTFSLANRIAYRESAFKESAASGSQRARRYFPFTAWDGIRSWAVNETDCLPSQR